MRLLPCAGCAVALIFAAPAFAGDQHPIPSGHPYPPEAGADYGPYGDAPRPAEDRYPDFDPAARDAWLADCHERLGPRDTGPGPGECEAYLDDYYRSYTGHGGYGEGPSMAHGRWSRFEPHHGMPMRPGVPMAQVEPRCVETIEYVTEEVPAPARRYIAPRRTKNKVVPDKRVKLKRIK